MHRKSAVAAAVLALAAGAASAQSIDFTQQDTVVFTELFDPDGGVFAPGSFTSGERGVLIGEGNGAFVLTYLGQESAFSDRIRISVNDSELTEFNQVGDTITGPLASGTPLPFAFIGGLGFVVENGTDFTEHSIHPSFAVLGTDVQTNMGTFAYVLGFNDAVDHDDWDDFVVGVNPIPEPQTYALLLAGLGVVGFVARRRRAG